MVDGVNFNPFTLKAWTADEITELDANKDGKVSESEVKAKWAWVAGQGQDAEGDISIENESDGLYGAAKNGGMTDKAETPQEFKSNMSILADEFVEQYMTQHPNLTDAERSSIQKLISTTSNSFVTEYLAENAQGPYDMQKVISDFQSKMNEAIANNEAVTTTVKASVTGLENNTDANFDSMTNLSRSAMQNKNVSNAEWSQIRNKTVQYLMGMLSKGENADSFVSNLDKNYLKNENYKAALTAIKALKEETDPVKMQQYITQAQNNLTAFLNSAGKDKVAVSIDNFAQAKVEAEVTEKVKNLADNWAESQITAGMSDAEKTKLNDFANVCVTKFAAKMAEQGRFVDGMSENEIQAEFTTFINTQKAELDKTQQALTRSASGVDSDYHNLISVSDAANANGNVSNEEKANIVSAGTTLIMNQLINDMEDIPLLQNLNPEYKNSTDYKTLETIIKNMKSSADPEEITKLQAQAKELITKMLNSYTGAQLVSGVDATKPIEVTGATKDKVIFNSSVSSDYQANVSRTTSRGKQDDGRLDEIQNMAKADLAAIAESLKAQLKSELGTAYNENDVQKYINDAINDTISLFTQNVSRRNGHGDYSAGSGEQAFVFSRRSGTSKGRYAYNLQALTNTFIQKFNETAKVKNEAKMDPSKATYDKENVIADSLGKEYDRDVKVKNNDKTALFNTAKAKLQSVAAALKASLIAEGCKVSTSDIDKILDDSMQETMSDFNFNTVRPDKFKNIHELFSYSANKNSFSTKALTDTFMDKVDAKLEEAKQKK